MELSVLLSIHHSTRATKVRLSNAGPSGQPTAGGRVTFGIIGLLTSSAATVTFLPILLRMLADLRKLDQRTGTGSLLDTKCVIHLLSTAPASCSRHLIGPS